MVNPWQDADLWSSVKPVRGVESFPSVERSLSRGTRDRDFEIVELPQQERENSICLKGEIFTNTLKGKLYELFMLNVWLREDYLRLSLKGQKK